MTRTDWITDPDHRLLDELCQRLSSSALAMDADPQGWPAEQLRWCADRGVFRWFLPQQWGGMQWSDEQILRGYMKLSAACLVTTFVITQRMGACQRLSKAADESLPRRLLPDLLSGDTFATVGISHLTTSRQHLKQSVLRCQPTTGGFRLEGFSPWVTGACKSDYVVVGAQLENDERQILVCAPGRHPHVDTPRPRPLVALNASQTGPWRCRTLEVSAECVIAGPVTNVMDSGVGGNTGGLQTSALALGVARAALDFLQAESAARGELAEAGAAMDAQWNQARQSLLAHARGDEGCSAGQVRADANSLVLRATQAALAAAKGAGFVQGHPAGKWCREALFFLVWSCPQPVMHANLCELAGIA